MGLCTRGKTRQLFIEVALAQPNVNIYTNFSNRFKSDEPEGNTAESPQRVRISVLRKLAQPRGSRSQTISCSLITQQHLFDQEGELAEGPAAKHRSLAVRYYTD
jgi:hypothetical protein